MNGGRGSSCTLEENQEVTAELGIKGPFEAQKEFSGHPQPSGRRKPSGMLISDEEITERFGDVLPKLDADRKTMAYQPFWNGMRNRREVEAALSAQADRA